VNRGLKVLAVNLEAILDALACRGNGFHPVEIKVVHAVETAAKVLREEAVSNINKSPTGQRESPKKRGPKVQDTTKKRADFAKSHLELNWSDMCDAYKAEYPGDKEVTPDKLRLAHGRQYPAT